MRGDAASAWRYSSTQPLADAVDRELERECVEVGDDGRHLDRHVVDVGAFHTIEDRTHPLVGFGVGQDRLAERVDVDAHTVGGPSSEVPCEVRIVRRDHDAVRLGLDLADHEWHHDAGEARRNERTGAQQQRVQAPDCVGVVGGDDIGEAPRCESGLVDPQHLVGHGEDQLTALLVGEERTEPRPPASLVARFVAEALREQSACELDGIVGEVRVGATGRPGEGRCVHLPMEHAAMASGLARIHRVETVKSTNSEPWDVARSPTVDTGECSIGRSKRSPTCWPRSPTSCSA